MMLPLRSVRMYISKYKQKLSNVVIALMVVLSNVVISLMVTLVSTISSSTIMKVLNERRWLYDCNYSVKSITKVRREDGAQKGAQDVFKFKFLATRKLIIVYDDLSNIMIDIKH